jgi:hypothetical protein
MNKTNTFKRLTVRAKKPSTKRLLHAKRCNPPSLFLSSF